jgi:hypothetical protein
MAKRKTYWNDGDECEARRVRIIVGRSGWPGWWAEHLIGEQRDAVEITYRGDTFYIDDEDGRGWRKVTELKGDAMAPHGDLAAERVVGERQKPHHRKRKRPRGTDHETFEGTPRTQVPDDPILQELREASERAVETHDPDEDE